VACGVLLVRLVPNLAAMVVLTAMARLVFVVGSGKAIDVTETAARKTALDAATKDAARSCHGPVAATRIITEKCAEAREGDAVHYACTVVVRATCEIEER
jgi:hypothetical protein